MSVWAPSQVRHSTPLRTGDVKKAMSTPPSTSLPLGYLCDTLCQDLSPILKLCRAGRCCKGGIRQKILSRLWLLHPSTAHKLQACIAM